MKKVLCLAVGVTWIALLAACGKPGESQPKGQEEVQQEAPAAQPAQEQAAKPAPAESETASPAPAKPKPQPREEAAPAPAPAQPGPAAPPVKVKKAGLGVIFKGNLEKGTFRIKADNDLIFELAFSGKETDAAKEFFIEPGQHVMKFVVIDDKGVRGVREETMNFVSGKHQTVRVSVKDTPGALIVEHLE